jgi:hypothetical protein
MENLPKAITRPFAPHKVSPFPHLALYEFFEKLAMPIELPSYHHLLIDSLFSATSIILQLSVFEDNKKAF